ncbi:MAG: ParB/Srx family N-terminal domain-containing protein [Methylococcaceae bacterium]|nr:ParB/Srx family N-terminal domain-containing protein [Methylococcaceae bacterium]
MKEKLAIEYLSVETVIPYARNARTHSREQIKQIAKSIHAFGFINPIIIDADGMIVAGHARALAAKEMGLSLVPAIRVDYLSEAEKRAYILADNKLAENAGWDQNLLKIELDYLSQIDINFDVDLTGFSVGEIV